MAENRLRIFLSSTAEDLRAERVIAWQVLLRLGWDVVRMEDFGSDPAAAWPRCRAGIENCDAMILLIGCRRGSPVLGKGGNTYTELEYEVAISNSVPVFPFVAADALDETDARLHDFLRRLDEAHTVARDGFRVGDYEALVRVLERSLVRPGELLARAAETPTAGADAAVLRPSPGRPRFARRGASSVADPLEYAIGHVRRDVLEERPCCVFIVDTQVVGEELYPQQPEERLLRKGLELLRELQQLGVDARLVNEVDVDAVGARERVLARAAKIRERADLTICVVHGSHDYGNVAAFANPKGWLTVVAPLRLSAPEGERVGNRWIEFEEVEIDSSALLSRALKHVRERVDAHVIEAL